MDLLRTKSVEQSLRDSEESEHSLRRELGALQPGTISGPAITISFAVAAIVCALAGLCYTEFASVVPVAGSAYTFSYASIGELTAWIIGWDLMLELALGAATVASGWSQYLRVVLSSSPWNPTCPRGSAASTTTSSRPRSCSS
jgi:APA family basic amino acid/polyamine antiporter